MEDYNIRQYAQKYIDHLHCLDKLNFIGVSSNLHIYECSKESLIGKKIEFPHFIEVDRDGVVERVKDYTKIFKYISLLS